VTNDTFSFETSPNTKPKDKNVGGHGILFPHHLQKARGHVPRVPHLIAPMIRCMPSLFEQQIHQNTTTVSTQVTGVPEFT